ncbi:cytochrome c-type biogenesis protein [Cognatishimia sp. MH4019]|uniref:cytochrome c-type biogenesis protein n=1 Tax=Cognatishimia sp. MH4019 TaxID=2854030 RepID=UPI001CD4C751|nr:cytochrome c-type biogenesis protein [Cognatishimia sp. MH4019]
MIRALLIWVLLATPVLALDPSELLQDPVLEDRAREISKGLRCPVCQNESIDESNATVAQDLRALVRERLLAGDSNTEVVDFVVDRYGEYVLLNPQTTGANLALWLAGPAMLLLGAGVAGVYIRRRDAQPKEQAGVLSKEEAARLSKILDD